MVDQTSSKEGVAVQFLETPQLWAFEKFGWFFSHNVFHIKHLVFLVFPFLDFNLPVLVLLITSLILQMPIILFPVPDFLRVIILYKFYNRPYGLNTDLFSNISRIIYIDEIDINRKFPTQVKSDLLNLKHYRLRTTLKILLFSFIIQSPFSLLNKP